MKKKIIMMIASAIFANSAIGKIDISVSNQSSDDAIFIGAFTDHQSEVEYVALFPMNSGLNKGFTETLNKDSSFTTVTIQYKMVRRPGNYVDTYCTLHITEKKVSIPYTTYETWAEYGPKNTGRTCYVTSGMTNSPALHFS